MKQAIICPFFGRLRDRFCEYGENLDVVERLERIAKIPGVQGVEMVYPHELGDLDNVKAALGRLGLAVSAVNVNVKSHPEFVRGSITSPDPTVRANALEYLKRAKDAAVKLGAERVTCCPLSDGYDYPFHIHYADAWDGMVEVVAEAASYRPEITLHLEYKPFETRVHNLLASAAKTILLCRAAGGKGLGVTIDIGHSTFGGEPPAESLMQVAAAGLPFYVHTNDNNGKLDWDLIAGACNVWEFAEFLFYLKELDYDGWITADVAPFRQDAAEVFALNVRFTEQLWQWLDEIDRDVIRDCLRKHDFLTIRKMMEPYIFPLLREKK
ncbi:MAG: sugar phosphate isomerase/epimerase [Phycisphaerales bacterium]|nr:MAG: sugar phosphate isomerase/epimerase [Phycisphaerales bacterium]